MKCKNCGNELKEGSKFCSYCGTKLENSNKFCANCGAGLDINSDYCVKCGAKVNKMVDKEENDKNATNYLIGAGICFILPWFSSYLPFGSLLNWASPVGVIAFLVMGMNKYPKKTYFKTLLIIYIILEVVYVIFILLVFVSCISACSNLPG